MKIDRRQLLLTSAAALAVNEAKAWTHGIGSGAASQKNLQINVPDSASVPHFQFVNVFLDNDAPFKLINNSIDDGFAYLDANGYPSGGGPPNGGNYTNTFSIYYIPPPATWTTEWTGNGGYFQIYNNAAFIQSPAGTIGVNSAFTFTINPAITNWSSVFAYGNDVSNIANFAKGSDGNYYACHQPNTGFDPTLDNGYYWTPIVTGYPIFMKITTGSGGTSQIKVYNSLNGYPSDHTIGDYSNFFDKNFLNVWKGFGTVRLTQWCGGIDTSVCKWTRRPLKTDTYSQMGQTLDKNWYCGTPPAPTKNAWVAPVDPPSYAGGGWVDKMQVYANLLLASDITSFNITNITSANPPQITTSTAHGYVNGDKVYFLENEILSNPVTFSNWVSGGPYTKGTIVTRSGDPNNNCYIAVQNNSSTTDPINDNGTNWSFVAAPASSVTLNGILGGPGPFTVTRIDATNFTIATNGSTWPTYKSAGRVFHQVTLATPSLSAQPVIFASTSAMGHLNGIFSGISVFTYDAELGVLLYQPYAGFSRGMPIETQVALVNALGGNGWFVVPHMADDDYVTNMATTILGSLTSGIAFYELSNEVWNGLWYETGYATTKAVTYAAAGTHGWTGPMPSYATYAYGAYSYSWYGWRFYSVANLIKTAYVGNLSKCNCVLAHVANNFSGNQLDGTYPAISGRNLATNCGLGAGNYPAKVADSLATSSYMAPCGANNGNHSTPLAGSMVWGYSYGNSTQRAAALVAFDLVWRDTFDVDYTENLYSYTSKGFPNFAAMAAQPNTVDGTIPARTMVQYEGGIGPYMNLYSISPNPYNPGSGNVNLTEDDVINLFWGYIQSTYAQTLLNQSPGSGTSSLQSWKANGGKYPSCYSWVGIWNPGNAAVGPIQPTDWGTQGPQVTAYKNFNKTGNP